MKQANSKHTPRKKGSSPQTKFTPEEVVLLNTLYKSGVRVKSIAKQFNIHPRTLNMVFKKT